MDGVRGGISDKGVGGCDKTQNGSLADGEVGIGIRQGKDGEKQFDERIDSKRV